MKAVVWSKDNCPYCSQAKDLLESKGIEFEERKIGSGWTTDDLFKEVPTARSVPQIFLNEEYVGGFKDLVIKLQG